MNDCLFTKLKAVVNDNSLPMFGFLKIHIKIAAGSSMGAKYIGENFGFDSQQTVKIVGDGQFLDSGGTGIGKSKVWNNTTWISEGEYDLLLPKYNINKFILQNATGREMKVKASELCYLTASALKFCPSYDCIDYDVDYVDFNALHGNYNEIDAGRVKFSGDISTTNFNGISVVILGSDTSLYSSEITGSILSFAVPTLTKMNIRKNTKLTIRTVEQFVAAMRTNAPAVSSVSLGYVDHNYADGFTIGGEEVNSLGANANCTLSWTENTITISNTSTGTVIRTVTA